MAAFLTCALLVPIGCSSKSKLIGTWKVDESKSTVQGKAIAGNSAEDALMHSVSIEFKKDDSYTLNLLFPVSGTYEVSGSTVTLHQKSVFGISSNSSSTADETGTISGDTFTLDQQGGDKLVFTKQGS